MHATIPQDEVLISIYSTVHILYTLPKHFPIVSLKEHKWANIPFGTDRTMSDQIVPRPICYHDNQWCTYPYSAHGCHDLHTTAGPRHVQCANVLKHTAKNNMEMACLCGNNFKAMFTQCIMGKNKELKVCVHVQCIIWLDSWAAFEPCCNTMNCEIVILINEYIYECNILMLLV